MNLHCSQSPSGTFRDPSPSRSASRRFADDKPWKARTQNGLGFRYEIADDLACRQDLVDQPGTLSPVQQGLVQLPPLARREHRLAQRFSMPAELVGAAQPPLDQVIARDPRQR